MATLQAIRAAYRDERATSVSKPPRTPLLVRAAKLAARVLPRARQLRTATLSLTGFGLLTAAAWTIAMPLGLAAAGISALLLEYLTASDSR